MDARINNLVSAVRELRDLEITQENVRNIKDCLDKIFMPDASCKNFIYTVNTDKLPFGCIVFPVWKDFNIDDYLITGNSVRISEYEIEIDSKMFDYGLTDEQVVSVMLYNIYHLVKDIVPLNRIREEIDLFFANTVTQLSIKSSIQYRTILTFGLVDALNQMTSCLYLPEEVQSDSFLDNLELYDFKDALEKLYREIPGCENEVTRQPKLSALAWSLRLYNDVSKERLPAICLLNKVKSITASILYINKANAVINALNRIDPDTYIQEAVQEVFTEAKRRGGLFASLKYNGLRDIESDLYEFTIRAKNAETEQDVMYALKQINARLAILDDYIREHPEDPELDRWVGVKMQYIDLRDQLAKKKLNRHNYGIFIDYNALDKLDDEEE